MKILLRSVTICDKNSSWNGKKADILIENGKITKIGNKLPKAPKEVNGKGRYITPGWVDSWAHFWDPGHEHKEDLQSGKEAAMKGGFTHVLSLPNTHPVVQTKNSLKYILEQNSHSVTAVHPMAAITQDTKGEKLTEMIDLHEYGAMAFTDGLKPLKQGHTLVKAIRYLKKMDGLLVQKPEDVGLNNDGHMHEGVTSTVLGLRGMPNIAENTQVQRDIELQEYAGGRLHFANVSTKESVSRIAKAKKSGAQVSCSVASYQTRYTDEDLEGFDTLLKVNPPFRTKKDNAALVKGIADGTIEVINSNHIPQDEESKNLEFDRADFGILSIQTVAADISRIGKEIGMENVLPAISTNPRELYRLPKSTIEKGADADITLFDPNCEWTFDEESNSSKSKNSRSLGTVLKGKCLMVVRGKNHWMDGDI